MLSKNIQFLRKACGISQIRLAEFVDVKSHQISDLESGRRTVILTQEQIDKLADLFMVESYDLQFTEITVIPLEALTKLPSEAAYQNLKSLSEFFKIIKNYQKMTAMAGI